MRECLTRRFSHIGDGTPSLSETPDLILLDGGDAHVHVGLEVMASMGLEIPLFGMVKDDFHKTRALTDGERELSIALDHGVYSFIYKLQEEAHRFAVKGTMASKTKTLTHSSLEKIEGIGPAKAKKLLAAMSLSEIRVASEEKLAAVSGISAENARAIAAYYKTKKTGEKKK
jgi:excinuclease ABC subunit C